MAPTVGRLAADSPRVRRTDSCAPAQGDDRLDRDRQPVGLPSGQTEHPEPSRARRRKGEVLAVSEAALDAGAHFHRTDLQVHTPRDANWGSKSLRPVDREAYARDFVRACRSKGLQAVAITDHHDFALFPYIKQAAAQEFDERGQPLPASERLVVFPGLELTLGVPCQALLILDADFPEAQLNSVLEALSCQVVPLEEEVLPAVTTIGHIQSLEDLQTTLDTRAWLVGRYIVLPNVTEKGHQTLLRAHMGVKYRSMPCVGGYVDGDFSQRVKGQGARKILAGEDSNYGNKRLAVFQTSDARSATFEDLGQHTSWIKWAQPTAEALRQACLAQESRIARAVPALPNIFIASLHVSNSNFLGPIDVQFNRQYNAIIGGRGTGKSTILEYLRWCLGDVPHAAEVDDEAAGAARRRRLIEATLTRLEAVVEVTVMINGISHVVRRASKDGGFSLQVGGGAFAPVPESAIQSLLPIHAYSQKQLSSVSVRADELARFVTAPLRPELEARDAAVTEVASRLRENYAALLRARGIDAALERARLNEQSLLDQAAHLRSGLTGLSDADQRFLQARPAVDESRQALQAWESSARQLELATAGLADDVDSALGQLAAVPAAAPVELAESLTNARAALVDATVALQQGLSAALAALRSASESEGSLSVAQQRARLDLVVLDERYEEVKGRSTVHAQQLEQLRDIEARRQQVASGVHSLRSERDRLGDPVAAQNSLRLQLRATHNERSDLLANQCSTVTELSSGLLRAELDRGRGLQGVDQRLRGLAAGAGVRAARWDALFTSVAAESNPVDTWERVLDELETLVSLAEGADFTTEVTPNLSRLGLTLADQQKLRTRLTVDGWLDLLLTPVEDVPTFFYRSKEQVYIPFESASAGQQATALLRVLLAQTGMPLLIDQPEEDLDSQVIQDVVEWLWISKGRRQVIFASHNANLVVNGDAELVMACDYRRAGDQSGGRVKMTGAIDIPELRDEITHIMEGGERAFKLRRDKYGF